jgi:hypothetical protein
MNTKTNSMKQLKQSVKASVFAAVVISISLLSCEKEDEKEHHHEEEVITTVQISLSAEGSADSATVKWSDTDGAGGSEPSIDTLYFNRTSNYRMYISFLDESGSETEDITEEIKEEANDHLICSYSNTGIVNSTLDTDNNGLPLGLEQIVSLDSAVNGDITFQLKHQPGVKTGTCDAGSTDIEVTFPVVIN